MDKVEYSKVYLEGYELGKQIKLSNKSIHYLSNITKLRYKDDKDKSEDYNNGDDLNYSFLTKTFASLSKSQKEKIRTLVGTTLSMRDREFIEKYHDITLNLVAEHEARAKSETITKEKQ